MVRHSILSQPTVREVHHDERVVHDNTSKGHHAKHAWYAQIIAHDQMAQDGADNAGQKVTSEIYLYQLKPGDMTMTKRMVLLM